MIRSSFIVISVTNKVDIKIFIHSLHYAIMQITRHGIISTNFYLFKPPALQHLSIWPTLASLMNILQMIIQLANHYKCRLAIIHQSTKEIFDFMHLYHQYYN